jgi:hypothetical protein
MAEAASIDRLLRILAQRVPDEVDALAREKRLVRQGLLSVGIKLHCLAGEDHFRRLITALGGADWLECNVFKSSRSRFCLVLPPVGNAEAAILLLEAIERYTGVRIFNNPDIQLQVCSPGRLAPRNAALHGIAFYLGSDTVRSYSLADFETTVSDRYYWRGKRLVIYDADQLEGLDDAFAWWAGSPDELIIRPRLPFLSSRTDLLVGPGSPLDIRNINLIATLLVHSQFPHADAYWSALGSSFRDEMISLLDRHLLSGVLEAPWVCAFHDAGRVDPRDDQSFFGALQDLSAYAIDEAKRLENGSGEGAQGGILAEMQDLLRKYFNEVSAASQRELLEVQMRFNSARTHSQSRSRSLLLECGIRLSQLFRTF